MISSDLFRFCNFPLLTEEGLRELIEFHGLTQHSHDVSDYDFFNAACKNERVTEGIIRYLLEYFPEAATATAEGGWSPLHHACYNPNVTLSIIQCLLEAAPDSVRSEDDDGWTPLHVLCKNEEVDEATSMQILNFLIAKYPEAVRHADNDGCLPIHFAAERFQTEFCRLLIETYPGSEKITDANGALLLHYACSTGSLATVEYCFDLYPNAILHQSPVGSYPIFIAIAGLTERDNPAVAVEIVKFFLDCDPNVKLQKCQGESLLSIACWWGYNDSNIDSAIEVIKAIYDSYPEAIEKDKIESNIHHYHQQVQAFINSELVYARQAEDRRLMTTPDENGRLPLHTALQNNVRLGSIKLLAKGNPLAVQSPDNGGVIPLHIACQHHDSTDVVRYLVELDTMTLDIVDRDGNTALHYACCGAKYDMIAMLLEDYGAVSVSRQNYEQKLPIEVLWESNEVDRDGLEYVESIFRLLKAYPETVMMEMTKEQANAGGSSPQSGKKRKYGE